MNITIWVGKEYLEQLLKNMTTNIPEDEAFDSIVEYTDVALMPQQIATTISYDKYIELKDRELLVEWSGQ